MKLKKRDRRPLPMPGRVVFDEYHEPYRPQPLSQYRWQFITPQLLHRIRQDVMLFLNYVDNQGEIYFPERPGAMKGIVILLGNFDTICEYEVPLLMDEGVPNKIIRLGRINKECVDVTAYRSIVSIDLAYELVCDFEAKKFATWKRGYNGNNKRKVLGEGGPVA